MDRKGFLSSNSFPFLSFKHSSLLTTNKSMDSIHAVTSLALVLELFRGSSFVLGPLPTDCVALCAPRQYSTALALRSIDRLFLALECQRDN